MMNPNVIILATPEKENILKIAIPYIKKNVSCNKIYIIANESFREKIDRIDGVIFFDESKVLEGLNYDSISDIIYDITGDRKKVGWYLQQFLKLAWAYVCEDDEYIAIDADTIPLSKIDFIDDNGKYLFTQKIEYHQQYFDTINSLFSGEINRAVDFSFIAEHMIFNCSYVKEMIQEILANSNLPGDTFYEKILYSIPQGEMFNFSFSEFETYGNFLYIRHPQSMSFRKLRTQREAVFLISSNPSSEQLSWAAKDYDIISLEQNEWTGTLVTFLTSKRLVRNLISIKWFARIRSKIRSIYRMAIRKPDFKFEDN